MKKVYVVGLNPSNWCKGELLRDYLRADFEGDSIGFVSSPQGALYTCASKIDEIFTQMQVSTNISANTISGEMYEGHEVVRGPFPHFGLSESEFSFGFKNPGSLSFDQLADLFPYWKKRHDEFCDKFCENLTTPDEFGLYLARQGWVNEQDSVFKGFVNTKASAEPVMEIIRDAANDPTGCLDSLVILATPGIVGATLNELSKLKGYQVNMQGFEGRKFNDFGGFAWRTGVKEVYSIGIKESYGKLN